MRGIRRTKIFLKNLISLPQRILFSKIAITVGMQDSKVDETVAILRNTKIYRTIIGRMTYIGQCCYIESAQIGAFTSISNNCFIGGANHPIHAVSMSPVFHQGDNVLKTNYANHPFHVFSQTVIGNDVWIGEGCKIKAGVVIGNGAIIGMGSVVTKNVGNYEIWAGNPARHIKDRFNPEVAQALEDIGWWNWTDEKLGKWADYFNSPNKLIGAYKK